MARLTQAHKNGLRQKIRRVLKQEFPKADITIDRPGSKVTGLIVWQGFDGLEQIDRQSHLWKILRSRLSPDEQFKIAAILTMAPVEWPRKTRSKHP